MKLTNRIEILKEYIAFCEDLGIDPTQRKNRAKFVKNYMAWYIAMYGIKDAAEHEKLIKNTLMYNTLSIAHIANKEV